MAIGHAKPRVLVIDSDHEHDNPLARSLREFDLVAVSTPFEAVALVTSGKRYDAIVCDLEMPMLSGPRLFERVQHVDAAQASRMILVTRVPDHPKVIEFRERTQVKVLPRSSSRDVLASAVRLLAAP